MKKWTIILLAAIIVIAFTVTALKTSSTPDNPTDNRIEDGQPVSVTLTIAKDSYAFGNAVNFTSVVRNNSAQPQSYTFSSTCTQGELYIDAKPTQRGLICGQAITDVTLEPGKERTYKYEFNLVNSFSEPQDEGDIVFGRELLLPTGKHEAYLQWKDISSEKVSFEVTK